MDGSDIVEYVPCYNFAMVCPGIYRSAHPTRKNFRFLRALRLKSVCYLCPEPYPEENVRFCEENNIAIFHFNLEENREPFSEVRRDIVDAVMRVVIDTRNHPILIHCERGRHRTGVICGCVRKLQGWSLGSIYSDYTLHNSGKGRLSDQQFLDLYEPIVKVELPFAPTWLLEDFTTGPTSSSSSALIRFQDSVVPKTGSDDGNANEDSSDWDFSSPIACNPQVAWSTTERLVGPSGHWGPVTMDDVVQAQSGKVQHNDSFKSHKTNCGLHCVTSSRSNVTLILCPNNRDRSLLQKETKPMILAVRPQCSYVLSEHLEDIGKTVEKDKKDKKDKSEKKDKKSGLSGAIET